MTGLSDSTKRCWYPSIIERAQAHTDLVKNPGHLLCQLSMHIRLTEWEVLCSEWNQIRKNCKLLVDWQTYYSSSSNHCNLPYKTKTKVNWWQIGIWLLMHGIIESIIPCINASQVFWNCMLLKTVSLKWEDNYHFRKELKIYRNGNFCERSE